MPENDAYDAEAIDDADPAGLERYAEGHDEYDFDKSAGSSFLDGMFLGKVPKKIAFPAIAVILLVLAVLLSAMTSENFGFGDDVDRISMKFSQTAGSEQENSEIEIEVYTSRNTFSKNFDGNAKMTVKYEDPGSEKTTLDNMKINKGHGTESYQYEEFYVDNGYYEFTVSAGGASASKEKVIKKTAKEIKPILFIEHNTSGDLNMKIRFHLMAMEGSVSLSDVVGTTGSGTMTVRYCDSGNNPRISESDVIATIEFTTTMDSLVYSIDDGSDKEADPIKDGSYTFAFSNNWINNNDHDGNYTMDMTFSNSFGKDPDTEKKEGYPHGSIDDKDLRDKRMWVNYMDQKEYSEE